MMKIEIKGVIVSNDDLWIYEWFEMEATSPKMVNEQLDKAGGNDIEVYINSGGGDVYAGSEIYTALKDYKGNVTTKIVGLAASMGSVIAMSGDKVLISPTAQIMIHNVSSIARGDYRDMQHESEVLKNYNKTIANAYILKSGMEQSELLELMNKETWLTAQQALELKLVDEIMFDNQQPKLVASVDVTIPESVISKIRNMKDVINPPKNKVNILMQKKLSAQLNLLKLGGNQID